MVKCAVLIVIHGVRVTARWLAHAARRDRSWRVHVVQEVDRIVNSTVLCGGREDAISACDGQVAELLSRGAKPLPYGQWHNLIERL